MDDARNLNKELVLKPFRCQTSSSNAAQQWQRRGIHIPPHPHLEGGKNCALSVRYTGQLCNVLAKHIMQRLTRFKQLFFRFCC